MNGFETILVLDHEVQAQLLGSILAERQIPHVIRSFHDSSFDGLFQNTQGWGQVQAPAQHRAEILAIFEEVKQQAAGGQS